MWIDGVSVAISVVPRRLRLSARWAALGPSQDSGRAEWPAQSGLEASGACCPTPARHSGARHAL